MAGFHYLDCTEELREENQKIKRMVKKIYRAKRRPEKLQDMLAPTGYISGGFNFILLL